MAFPALRFGFGSGEVLLGRRREEGRLVCAGVVLDLEPVVGLMGGQILEAELLIEFPHFHIESLDILVPLALLPYASGLLLALQPDLLQVDLLGRSDDVVDGFVVLGDYPALLVVGGLLDE